MKQLRNYQCNCTNNCFITYGDRIYRDNDESDFDGDYEILHH